MNNVTEIVIRFTCRPLIQLAYQINCTNVLQLFLEFEHTFRSMTFYHKYETVGYLHDF